MTLTLRGTLGTDAVAQVHGAAASSAPLVRIDLDDAEPPAPEVLAELVTALDAVLASGKRVVLVGAPQMLAHTLYKAGRTRTGGVTLERPREEEPYAG